MENTQVLSSIVIALNAGMLALLLADRLKLPNILFYLSFGILLGPHFLGWVHPESLGGVFPVIIELGVAFIMFEGALHLNISQYRSASQAIQRLLSVGLVVSVVLIMLLTKWLFAWPWGVALLFGVLMSVTGPAVITPIIRKVALKKPIGSILHWESILLEPVIVVGALLIVEFLQQEGVTLFHSFARLIKIVLVGGATGVVCGGILRFWLKRASAKQEGLRNLLLIAVALLIFELSNILSKDSGLVAVVGAGMILGNSALPALYEIKQFKETLTRVMISILFILLCANLDWESVTSFSPAVIFLLVSVIFVVRPLAVFAATAGTGLNTSGKLFLSLTAPRGIVAASLASLVTLLFAKPGQQGNSFEALAYQVIFVTVLLQSLWSQPLAKLLKVEEAEKKGFLIIGAHELGRRLAKWLNQNEVETVLVDRDSYDIYLAKRQGINAVKGDALKESFLEELPLQTIGHLMALTSNNEVNTLACQLGERYFEHHKTYQLQDRVPKEENTDHFLKSAGGDLIFPQLPTLTLVLEELRQKHWHFAQFSQVPENNFIPLFLKLPNGSVQAITAESKIPESAEVFGIVQAKEEVSLSS